MKLFRDKLIGSRCGFSPVLFTVIGLLTATYCFSQPRSQNPEYKKYNPSYHYYPSGDPTGLFYTDGKYYNNWGNAYTEDLVHWKYSPNGSQALRLKLLD